MSDEEALEMTRQRDYYRDAALVLAVMLNPDQGAGEAEEAVSDLMDLRERYARAERERDELRAENMRLAGQVNALVEVIRGVVVASRPGTPKEEKDTAWRCAGVILDIETCRRDPDFMKRLAAVRDRNP